MRGPQKKQLPDEEFSIKEEQLLRQKLYETQKLIATLQTKNEKFFC